MKCIICGRFMKDHGVLPDPENLEPEVVKSFYCTKDDFWQYENQYWKGAHSLAKREEAKAQAWKVYKEAKASAEKAYREAEG